MSIYSRILTRQEFINDPPILIDIGASGTIHKGWKRIAKWSICIAFDADDRDFMVSENVESGYNRLYVYNRIVTTTAQKENDFYLTHSPHCSSLLRPDTISLENWAFSPKFEVKKKAKLKSITLPEALKELNISKIDWFKTDSQGIDLKLFKSIDEPIRNNIVIAEFEPGILDAYEGEDKLHEVLSYMEETKRFWLSRLTIKGTQRINYNNLRTVLGSDFLSEVSPYINKIAPGWGEMMFMNSFDRNALSKRDLLLGWVFASLQGEHGFAYELALKGIQAFQDESIFYELKNRSIRKIRGGFITLKYIPLFFSKSNKIIKKLIG